MGGIRESAQKLMRGFDHCLPCVSILNCWCSNYFKILYTCLNVGTFKSLVVNRSCVRVCVRMCVCVKDLSVYQHVNVHGCVYNCVNDLLLHADSVGLAPATQPLSPLLSSVPSFSSSLFAQSSILIAPTFCSHHTQLFCLLKILKSLQCTIHRSPTNAHLNHASADCS